MKKTFALFCIILPLAFFACTRPQTATSPAPTPADEKEVERNADRTTVTSTAPGEEQLESDDQQDSKVTGFGEDPGEETQE